ncbi:MAG: TetR/AcrR family transcriptional regulator [Mesorhizobium sp.]|nr:MAG: TetR/AcrR family transcriptional regulator [Mesorhizobium sp.]
MKARRTNSRDKILAAAADVARETGPGSLSLDAVASRAGVSKGGLLYNFPTKAKLMQALVEDYLRAFEQALESARTAGASGESPLATYIKLSAEHAEESKSFRRQVFERLKGETPDLKALLVCYLAIEGLRSMNLFDSDVLSVDERRLLVSSLLEIAG